MHSTEVREGGIGPCEQSMWGLDAPSKVRGIGQTDDILTRWHHQKNQGWGILSLEAHHSIAELCGGS